MAISHSKSVTIADFTGTVTVFNSLGATQTANATDLVRPSDWNSVHNQYYTLSGNTNNASTVSGTNVVFQGAGAVTLTGTNQTIKAAVLSRRALLKGAAALENLLRVAEVPTRLRGDS